MLHRRHEVSQDVPSYLLRRAVWEVVLPELVFESPA